MIHTALCKEELESREDPKRFGEVKYSFKYWPGSVPSMPTPTNVRLSYWPLLKHGVFEECRLLKNH